MKKNPMNMVLIFVVMIAAIAIAATVYLHAHSGSKSPTKDTGQQQSQSQTGETTNSQTADAGQNSGQNQPPAQRPSQKPSDAQANNDSRPGKPADDNQQASNQSPAELFCGRDRSDVSSRTNDAVTLAQAGGVVQIFQHEAALSDPYGCADFYLKHGLNIDATDPRPDSGHLTGLHYAIQRNDPKMVQFMLDHGADVHERAGAKKIRPYGYAVFLALKNQSTNYNHVIGMLDSALDSQKPSSRTASNTDDGHQKTSGRSGAM